MKDSSIKNLLNVSDIILSNQININKSTMRPFDFLDESPVENSPDPPTAAATAFGDENLKNKFGC